MAARAEPLLITGGLILADAATPPRRADLLVEQGRIAAIEAPGVIDGSRGAPFDARDRLIAPGLVNAHTHSHGGLAKGLVGDRAPLEVFLTGAGPANAGRGLADKKLSAMLTAVELVRRGCTACYDLFLEFPTPSAEGLAAVAEAYAAVGMRAVIAPMMADRTLFEALPGLLDSLPAPMRAQAEALKAAPFEASLAAARAAFDAWSADRAMIRPAVAPTIPLHCSDAFLRGCARLAEDHDIGLQTHLAETNAQRRMGERRYGRSLTAHLDGLGLLGPRFSAAHAIWLDDEDMKRIGDSGGSVSHNPMSNLRLGSGVAPARRLLEAGVRLGIGTDASNTSDGQNMFEATRLAAYLSRITDADPARWLTAGEAFAAATVGGAEILGFERTGRLDVGWAADMIFLDLGHVTYMPLRQPLLQLVFAESGAALRSVMIAGRLALDKGRLTGVDEAALRAQADAAQERLDAVNAAAMASADPLADLVGCFCLAHARADLPLRRAVWPQAT